MSSFGAVKIRTVVTSTTSESEFVGYEGHHTTSRESLIAEFEAIAAFLDRHV